MHDVMRQIRQEDLCEATWPYGNVQRESYRMYRDALSTDRNKRPLDSRTYAALNKRFCELLSEELIRGKFVDLPAGLGHMWYRVKRDRRPLEIDWDATFAERERTGDRGATLRRPSRGWTLALEWICPRFEEQGLFNATYGFKPCGRWAARLDALVDGRAPDDPLAEGFSIFNFPVNRDLRFLQANRKKYVSNGTWLHKRKEAG